ncbi:hypothetical protein L6452_00795 [Arctium lappa]|uniref:Uncharacterized protein n=1 Tax=Arctium lappa TaxID=4217 RepID=A0ACB9FFQ3_ARCLA|nr:hypothetical protein L6452_00795 [Arctium lappa]
MWRNKTYDSFYTGPLTFLTLLYVKSVVCDIKDLPNGVPPLRRWSMDHLRQRLATGIKEGGLRMEKLKHLLASMPRPIRQTQAKDVPSTSRHHATLTPLRWSFNYALKNGNTLLIQDIVMELNDKLALLMRTKVDARTLIVRAKEIFPDESLFERYEDELTTLFNEHGLGGSSEKRAKPVQI